MLTLGTQRHLTNDALIQGIIDSVVTVNQFYQMLPFKGIQGNALAYNRGNDSSELTTIIGDAQVNGLIQSVGSDFHDATVVEYKPTARDYIKSLF